MSHKLALLVSLSLLSACHRQEKQSEPLTINASSIESPPCPGFYITETKTILQGDGSNRVTYSVERSGYDQADRLYWDRRHDPTSYYTERSSIRVCEEELLTKLLNAVHDLGAKITVQPQETTAPIFNIQTKAINAP